jgi:N-acetyl-anhydromuramyl-L-alanine amidase AmpD
MNIIRLPSPNFDYASNKIGAVVLHGTSGPLWASINWLRNPQKDGKYGRVSSNYVIAKTGELYMLVDHRAGKRAYGNGTVNMQDKRLIWLRNALRERINPNYVTISIEHEASYDEMINGASMTDAQFNTSTELVITLLRENDLDIGLQAVCGHYQIDGWNKPHCPGVINIPAYLEVLKLRRDWYK